MIARFTAERIKGAGKSSIFNLGDDFNLTHGGEKLNDIDKFDNPNSDQEDEDELLGKEFVDEAHFGGFMTKADDDFKSGKANSRKEYIENLIRESKKKKAEKKFVCSHSGCGLSFGSKSSLSSHYRYVVSNEFVRNFCMVKLEQTLFGR